MPENFGDLDLHLDLTVSMYIYQQWGNYSRKLQAPTHKSAASKNNKEELFNYQEQTKS